ncbi:hypothetical protein T492DRAFT_890981 [Pavlovales sp. CCMP2436]|nr:hypothetical protein T492DRAFT_890981 [Pavlovales sp. CCMP2436]
MSRPRMPEFAPKTRGIGEVLAEPDLAELDPVLAQLGDEDQQKLLRRLAPKLAAAQISDGASAAELAKLLRYMQLAMEAEGARAEQADEDFEKLKLVRDSAENAKSSEAGDLREELADAKADGKKARSDLRALEDKLREREEELREKSEEIEDTRGFMKKEAAISGGGGGGGGGKAAEQMRSRISQLEEDLRNAQAEKKRTTNKLTTLDEELERQREALDKAKRDTREARKVLEEEVDSLNDKMQAKDERLKVRVTAVYLSLNHSRKGAGAGRA